MALINCPECGKEVSDQALACPSCAYPILGSEQEEEESIPTKIKYKDPGSVVRRSFQIIGVMVGGVVLSGILYQTLPPETPPRVVSDTPSHVPAAPAVTAPAPAPETWRTDLSIVKKSWNLSEFSVATWKLKIKNSSQQNAYKDIHFKTTYWAKSGTKVDESLLGHTEYLDIPPGRTVDIEFTEFTHRQAARAVIEVDGAVRW